MSTESKNHHYNPQSVLKRFSLGKNQVITFDKSQLRSYPSSVTKTGSENYFNTIKLDGEKLNFESLFDINDRILSNLLDDIIDKESVNHLSQIQQNQLATVIAHQIIRTKRTRTETSDYIKRVNEFTKDAAKRMNGEPRLLQEFESEEDEKLITLIKLKSVYEIVDSLLEKQITFISAKRSGKYLWTSDFPVVMNNTFDYGKIGLNQKGIEIYYPISKYFAIGYFCKSIISKYSIVRDMDSSINMLVSTLENNGTFTFNEKNVNHLNHLQITNSTRYVYAPKVDFDKEIEFLKKHENYKSIRTKIGFGNEVNTNPRIPLGHVIVFYTKEKHFMISAEKVISEIDMTIITNEIKIFIMMTTNDPIERLEYFKDQQTVRGMSEIEVLALNLENKEIKIGTSNPAVKFMLNLVKGKNINGD